MWHEPPYRKAELVEIGDQEMVAQLDDFLRRRSSLALTERHDELATKRSDFERLLGIDSVPAVHS